MNVKRRGNRFRARRATLFFLAVTLSGPGQAEIEQQSQDYAALAIWTKTTTGCGIQSFDHRPDTVISWSGTCVDGLVTGVGTMDAENYGQHETYEGNMQFGVPEGHGIYRRADGKTIEGNFHQGLVGGIVKFTAPNGYHYEGSWDHGLEEGYGTAVWKDGSRYDGEWHLGKMDGNGKLEYSDGAVYEGAFRNGLREGYGVRMRTSDGSRYEGDWKAGNEDGSATITDGVGNRFTGTVCNWMRCGRGKLVLKSGNYYEGDWADNAPNGRGVYVWVNGDHFDGEWRNWRPDGEGILTKQDGTRYSGTWKQGCFQGGDQHTALFVDAAKCQQ